MVPVVSGAPSVLANCRRVVEVTSGSVPRKRAQAAWEDAATALEPPPKAFCAKSLSSLSGVSDPNTKARQCFVQARHARQVRELHGS